ncbi:MAG: cotH, partial [Verrucomicrobiales bacterium]|nr:cotH [Verrucomicrobiales bacterium]
MPSPKANFARVVINGENWGIYNNVEQFNKDFVKEWYGTTKGARFKVRGSPNGQGSLKYLGDDPKAYKGIYSLKSKEDATVWPSFIKMTKVLNETPPDKLVEALSPLLDIDGALRFIALDNALINNDGYWIRTSDYSIYQDVKGQFHVIAQDANETFVKPGGPGFGGGGGRGGPGGRQGGPGGPGGQGQAGGPGGPNGQGGPGAPGQPQLANGPGGPGQQGGPGGPGGPGRGFGGGGRGNNMPAIKGIELDPLLAVSDPNKPLVSKLLAVPALKAKYLGYVKDIADKKLDWNYLGPIATGYHNLIDEGVKEDTRKLETTEDFDKSLIEDIKGNGGGPGGSMGIKSFADQRRAYLLNYTEKKKEETEEKK